MRHRARFLQCGQAATVVATLAVAALIAGAACTSTRPCRQGTLFVTVRLGPFSDADSLTLDVTVVGSLSRRTTLPLSKVASGGIEVTFPSGYPTGKSVTVVVELDKGSVPLAMRTGSSVLASRCGVLEVDFGGSDAAGTDSMPGSGGGGSGGGGDTGGSGGVGTAGMSGATGGSGGGGGGGVAGASGGGGGAGGAAGTGGRGGTIGSGGRGGGDAGGVGVGTGGRGGATGCVPTSTTENCYNNIDDDCNGLTDCADSACDTPAQCVTLDPTLGPIGASIATTATCPVQASTVRTLTSALVAAGCAGCKCGSEAGISCSADIYGYDTLAACNDVTQPGTLVHTLTPAEGCFTPNWSSVSPTSFGSISGVRAPQFQGTPIGACAPSGVATTGIPVWSTITKFCTVPSVGGGCGPGAACVPRPVVAVGVCLLQDGTHACPNGLRASSWFAGFTDSRTCGACTCGPPTGGDCGSMLIGIGSDFSCQDPPLNGYLLNVSRRCFAATGGVYSPGVQFAGTPIPPTCQPSAPTVGALSPSGPQTLCCL